MTRAWVLQEVRQMRFEELRGPSGVRSCNTTCSSVDCPAMARPLRIEFPHAIYHVTSRGYARQRIVKTDADRQAWRMRLGQDVELIRLSEVW